MGTGHPDMCFRCKEVGMAGWIHVIATCRCIQEYWDGIFAMLTTMAPVSISPSILLMSLGYDPEARLSSRWEKLVFIATAVARSLLLRNWRSELSPTSQEWRCKMTQVRVQEMRYASRVVSAKKFFLIWGDYFLEKPG
ncbi:hypothetical protein NDU88_005478 [Pleurodeles waltl]|uniref:Uncharacterized protein n=1 Tax=Pleurodeles waltl TaxID=8319 RepID=A0AAV7QEU9_PLEWA|nr:hypothetical protein NDU88_005478 [Pleurodeles waltl]